jgi:hypothetical protein
MTVAVASPPQHHSSVPDAFVPEVPCLHIHHFSSRAITVWRETRTHETTSHSSVVRHVRCEAYAVASRCIRSKLSGALDWFQSDPFDDFKCLRLLQEDLRHTSDLIARQFRLLQFKLRLPGRAGTSRPRPMPSCCIAELALAEALRTHTRGCSKRLRSRSPRMLLYGV